MSDFEILSLVLMIISIVIALLLEIIKGNKKLTTSCVWSPWDSYLKVINPKNNRLSAIPLSITLQFMKKWKSTYIWF